MTFSTQGPLVFLLAVVAFIHGAAISYPTEPYPLEVRINFTDQADRALPLWKNGSEKEHDVVPENICHLHPDPGNCTGSSSAPVIHWYFDTYRHQCLAFSYSGCGGNQNRFMFRSLCSLECETLDGPTCVMNTPSHPGLPSSPLLLDRYGNVDRSCTNLMCPTGYRCKQGAIGGVGRCCSIESESQYVDTHEENGLCQQSPLSQNNEDIVVGPSCSLLRCPADYECKQNRFFANCCPRSNQQQSIDIDHNLTKRDTPIKNTRVPAWITSGKFQGDIAGFQNQHEFDEFAKRINQWRMQVDRNNGTYSSAVLDPHRLWPGGVVPYVIDSSSQQLIHIVEKAIQDFHTHTCVRFIKRTKEDAYVNIVDNLEGCTSYLGKQHRQPQTLSLSSVYCLTKGTVLHELMHAIGFWHEHQRTDRDDVVEILQQNIDSNCYENNYKKAAIDRMRLIGRYDVDSIMHYPGMNACSKNGKSTIRLKHSHRSDFGTSESLTDEDIWKIRKLYNCHHHCPAKFPETFVKNNRHYPSCGVVYDETDCGGVDLKLSIQSIINLVHQPHQRSGNWHGNVRSASVRPGCTLNMCSQAWMGGQCTHKEGGAQGANMPSIDHPVASMWCSCYPASYTHGNWGGVKRGQAPPDRIPDYCANRGQPTCAIGLEGFMPGAWGFCITPNMNDRNRDQTMMSAFSYIATSGCTLHYCERENFSGRCNTMKPFQYLQIEHYEPHSIKSYNCTC